MSEEKIDRLVQIRVAAEQDPTADWLNREVARIEQEIAGRAGLRSSALETSMLHAYQQPVTSRKSKSTAYRSPSAA